MGQDDPLWGWWELGHLVPPLVGSRTPLTTRLWSRCLFGRAFHRFSRQGSRTRSVRPGFNVRGGRREPRSGGLAQQRSARHAPTGAGPASSSNTNLSTHAACPASRGCEGIRDSRWCMPDLGHGAFPWPNTAKSPCKCLKHPGGHTEVKSGTKCLQNLHFEVVVRPRFTRERSLVQAQPCPCWIYRSLLSIWPIPALADCLPWPGRSLLAQQTWH